ncbi:MAG: hypothetical protein QOG62_329 [Thermoleophilaceae bacterium]|jgi:hypothetical protein|nr:hypothetical protein [Thermoleophilaceae bacterium]
MYQFSRSLYRELAPEVTGDCLGGTRANKTQFLASCEAAVERIATDRHYFAKPARSLYRDVRALFPMQSQLRAYRVIERHMTLASEFVERAELAGRTLDGAPLSCHASTRRGTACQRIPLPGNKYCPSHRHLEELAA